MMRLDYYPEVLPGWEVLAPGVHARHVSLRIPRTQSMPSVESQRALMDMLRQHVEGRGRKPFGWRRWRFPVDDSNDMYVVGCLFVAA